MKSFYSQLAHFQKSDRLSIHMDKNKIIFATFIVDSQTIKLYLNFTSSSRHMGVGGGQNKVDIRYSFYARCAKHKH